LAFAEDSAAADASSAAHLILEPVMRIRMLLGGLAATSLLAGCDSSPTASVPNFLDCDRVESISIGETVNGQLSGSDCVLAEDGTLVDYYTFRVSSSRSVTITMRSNDVDSFLFLIDEDGDLVDYDDDGDPNTELGSRIDVTLPEGRYYIGANAYEDDAGSYTLYTN
jgi:hypothetical protein